MTRDSTAVLHPVAFGARRCRGNEVRLHSHLGEGFSGDWAMNKCRHMLFGQHFVWTTDCYAIKFILSYDGANPAILRLQMRLMCWDVDIVHQNDHYIADADYWSRLGADLCFDPLFKTYLELTRSLRKENPPPTYHVLPHHQMTLPTPRMPHTARPLPLHCSLMIAVGYATYPMSLSNSVTLRNHYCRRHVRCTMTNSPAMLSRSSSSVGPYIPSMVAILHQLFNLGTCPSK
jgi:hypothetical protein